MRRTSRTFIQETIARGYRPVTEPDAAVRGHLTLFLGVAANLFVRGMVDRPIDSIRWGSNDKYWRLISGTLESGPGQ